MRLTFQLPLVSGNMCIFLSVPDLFYSLFSSSIHVAAPNRITFFLQINNIQLCVYSTFSFLILPYHGDAVASLSWLL